MKVEISMGSDKNKYDEYEVKSAFETLCRAAEIKQDKELMSEVQILADKKKKAISSIADIKNRYAQMVDKDDSEEEESEMPTKEGVKPKSPEASVMKDAQDDLPPERLVDSYKELKAAELKAGSYKDSDD